MIRKIREYLPLRSQKRCICEIKEGSIFKNLWNSSKTTTSGLSYEKKNSSRASGVVSRIYSGRLRFAELFYQFCLSHPSPSSDDKK